MLCKQRVEESLQHCLARTPPIKLLNENYGESPSHKLTRYMLDGSNSLTPAPQPRPSPLVPALLASAAALLRQVLSFAHPGARVWLYKAVTRFKLSLALLPGEGKLLPPYGSGWGRQRAGAKLLAALGPAERGCLPAAARAPPPWGAAAGTTGLPYRPGAPVPTRWPARAHRRPGRAGRNAP